MLTDTQRETNSLSFQNTALSHLNYDKLSSFIINHKALNLEYRNFLGLPHSLTFGVEIEFENASLFNVDCFLEEKHFDQKGWQGVLERSIDDSTEEALSKGGEVVSPILTDNDYTWDRINTICSFISSIGGIACKKAGGHIHFGSQVFNNCSSLMNFLKLWVAYEDIIYRFSFGEYNMARDNITKFAYPVKQEIYKTIVQSKRITMCLDSFFKVLSTLGIPKTTGIDFSRLSCFEMCTGNTIEIRCPNGTLNPIIWQNNVYFFAKLLLYCSSPNFDVSFIENQIEFPLKNDLFKILDSEVRTKQIRNTIKSYTTINLLKATQLADLIFDNDLDKLYFLKQYLKGFINVNGTDKVMRKVKF